MELKKLPNVILFIFPRFHFSLLSSFSLLISNLLPSLNALIFIMLYNPKIISLSIFSILLLSIFHLYYHLPLLYFKYCSTPNLFFFSPPPLSLSSPSSSPSPLPPLPPFLTSPPLLPLKRIRFEEGCDVTRGRWIRDPDAPYYTNETCWAIQGHQNCMKFGRPNMEFLKWRWKPDGCELPLFDPVAFLEIVRGKSIAFVGDSLARNQMQSLICLLSKVEYPEDMSVTSDPNLKTMYYKSFEFTIYFFWSPFLVEADDKQTSVWNVHLDRVDKTWYTHLRKFNYLIISSGNWFTRPSLYYRRRKLVGCNYCHIGKKLERITLYDANQKAFQTAFWAITNSRQFDGMTILRSSSPNHFENGKWDRGGDCKRTAPIKEHEIRWENDDEMKVYYKQLEQFIKAKETAKGKGLEFRLLDTTHAMLLRPDGHPSKYGHLPNANVTLYNDCVHWCLPGPIDMWNHLLLQILK